MIAWITAVVGIVTAGVIWLRARRTADQVPHIKDYIYLNRKRVMDMYRQGEYKVTRRDFQKKTTNKRKVDVTGTIHGFGVTGGRSVEEEVFSTWVEQADPLVVIDTVMDAMEKAGDVVHVDLTKQHDMSDRALRASLGELLDESANNYTVSVRLSQHRYVLLTGQFHRIGTVSGETAFLAPYESPAAANQRPRIRMTCSTGQHAEPTGTPFQGRCLGVVERWDRKERELVLRPIAIFS
jgi:hypothetical protein